MCTSKINKNVFLFAGLPHSHILLILDPADRLNTADDIDCMVSAELPDPEQSEQARRLHDIVVNSMTHAQCGPANPAAGCMRDGKCSKHFPKEFANQTEWRDDSPYPVYRRRAPDAGGQQVEHRGRLLDNRWVVPYSPLLSLRYCCHINVEVCCSVESVKYLFKYIYKGHDRQMVRTDQPQAAAAAATADEIEDFHDLRSIGASEACWRLFQFDMSSRSPAVEPLQVHLENHQVVFFEEGQEQPAAAAEPKDTPLTGWMRYNRDSAAADPDCLALRYPDFPRHCRWDKSRRRWIRRQNHQAAPTIGRVVTVSPRQGDIFYLRMLLHHIPGATSFAALRTVDGEVCATYQEACRRRGLLQEDGEWDATLEEAAMTHMPTQLRQLLVVILLFCEPANPAALFEQHHIALAEDFARRHQNIDAAVTRSLALLDIERRLQRAGKELADVQLPAVPEEHRLLAAQLEEAAELRRLPPVIQEELAYDREALREQTNARLPTLLPSQRAVADVVLAAVRERRPLAVYIDAPGGTGKTYTLNTLLAAVRADGEVALAVAFSGIAATLLDGGRTFHSRFKAPLQATATSTCNVPVQSPLADLIRRARLIVWDEAPMAHRHLLEALDRTLRDVLATDEPFGGKVMVLGGDFRQILPVIR